MFDHLLSPPVLSFFLGVLSVFLKSDLKLPEGLYSTLSIYLLFSLGLKGGVSLGESSLSIFWPSCLGVLTLGVLTPLAAFGAASLTRSFSSDDRAALAAHYGSVSVVTFMACKAFLKCKGYYTGPIMTAFLAVLEVPGILIGISLGSRDKNIPFLKVMKDLLVSKSILILVGGLLIGFISGPCGLNSVAPFFIEPFQGVLVFFLLEMGIVTASHFKGIQDQKSLVLLFLGILIPLVNGMIGLCVAKLMGFEFGDAVLLSCMCASASYIAAPAIVRVCLPKANPGYYLVSALVITFPFNLILGIPLYHFVAGWFF